ncbi:uncharacterized protein LOC135696115 [Rhopilema esculentum]|uniref:uncharacterized protein LOC135696115 n=1 Tax=Rhopilema esculentum TaxID=499914 RepID=UPI0031E38677|eukprot:gene11989-2572_t
MSASSKRRLEDALMVGREIAANGDEEPREEKKGIVENVQKFKLGDDNGVFSVQFDNSGGKAATGLGSGSIQLYSSLKLERIRKLLPGSFIGLPVMSVKFYPTTTKNLLLAAGADGSISVWDTEKLVHNESIDEPGNQIGAMDFSNDGTYFATAGKDKSVRLYDSETLQLKKNYFGVDVLEMESDEISSSESGHSRKILALKFHPDDRDVILTAGWDHTVKIWDIRTDGVVRTVRGPFVCGDGLDVLGDEILTGSWVAHHSLQVWDYASGKMIDELPFPVSDHQGEFLYCARFWNSKTVVAGGSGSNDVKIISRETKTVIDSIDGENHCVQAMDINKKTKKIIFGTSGNILKLANIDYDD